MTQKIVRFLKWVAILLSGLLVLLVLAFLAVIIGYVVFLVSQGQTPAEAINTLASVGTLVVVAFIVRSGIEMMPPAEQADSAMSIATMQVISMVMFLFLVIVIGSIVLWIRRPRR